MIDEKSLRSLYEHHADAIAVCNEDGVIQSVNSALERLVGFDAAELFGRNYETLLVGGEIPKVQAAFLDATHGIVRDVETLLVDRQGRHIWVELDAIPIVVDDVIGGIYAVARDISRLKHAITTLREHEDRIRSLYMIAATQNKTPDQQIDELLRVGCRLLGMETGFITHVNSSTLKVTHVFSTTNALALHRMVGLEGSFSRHIFAAEVPFAIDSLRDSAWCADDVGDLMAWSSLIATRIRIGRTNYGTIEFRDPNPRRGPFTDTDRDLIALMSAFVATEIQRERTEQQLDQLAYYDALTKLPNRTLFNDRLNHALSAAKRTAKNLALLFLDLDNFKGINDELGHDAGDLLLRVVADRLRSCVRASDTVARLGGDEFTILLPEIRSPADAGETATKIITALGPAIKLGETERRVTTSIGVSIYPTDGHSVTLLMKHADMAMYSAKQQGRNRFAVFEPTMSDMPAKR